MKKYKNNIALKNDLQIFDLWNQTDQPYPSEKTIQELFEEQVERTPENIALVYEETKLTYRELNERANQLANYLREIQDISPDTLIALCLDRSEHMLIAILGVLKSGGAYVPMDPSYPDDRIRYIMEDTDTKLVLTNERHQQKIKDISKSPSASIIDQERAVIALDSEELQHQLITKLKSNPKTITRSTNLAYVIYTSGTTGHPKGVMIEHKSLISRITYLINKHKITPSFNIAAKIPYVFDPSLREFFLALLSGAKLIILSEEVYKNTMKLANYCIKNKVNLLIFVPSHLAEFLGDLRDLQLKFNKLQTLYLCGESLQRNLVLELKKYLPHLIIKNQYGPTEGCLFCFEFNLSSHAQLPNTIPVGKIVDNMKAYVLDKNMVPLPIGAVGELHIGGVGLARGYLNKPELTAQKFILNPFQTEEEKGQDKNARLYKTGDLVRWLPDGNLEYIGRNDFQVKIRGYRIELEEIESALSSYENIRRSVVLAKEQVDVEGVPTGNKYLVGYYIAEKKLEEESIFSYLHTKLPEYMVPIRLVHLENFPLTINGKLDRKALPEPEITASEEYLAPRNELESRVCEIWAEVLGLPSDKVGIRDDFFKLGGNSILAIRLTSRLNKILNSNFSVSFIFKCPTIDKLIPHFGHNTEGTISIVPFNVLKPEDQKLSFAQERLWFIERYEEGTNAYNVPLIYKLTSSVKLDVLENSFRNIVKRHEILRTVIKEDDEGNTYQQVLDDKEHPLEIKKVVVGDREELDEEISKEVNQIHDLSKNYPIKICLYELISNEGSSKEYYLSVVIHHIAFDGWSMDIFLREFKTYYDYYLRSSEGGEDSLFLPTLSIQYKDFALWQRSYLNQERLEKQLNYWKEKLNNYESLNLITDNPRPSQIDYKGAEVFFELDEKTSGTLRELAKELKVSLYSLLLSGYYLMLRSYSNQDSIVIGATVANRHYNQVENLIGFFVNSLPLRIEIDSESLIKEFIQAVGREVIGMQLHQDLPFERLVEELKVPKDTSRHPIFQVIFDVQSFGYELSKESNELTETNLTNLLQSYITGSSLYNVAKFDISTFVDDSQICLRGSFNYAVSLYSETTIKGFIEVYTQLLKQLANLAGNKQRQEKTKITDLSYLNKDQYKQIIDIWNQTDKDYPHDKTIHELFEEQVDRTPDNIAVVYEDTKLTYRELNERSNQLANYLVQTNNIKPDTLIALCLERSEHMLIAILATLKAGAAYVPMDPSYPESWIGYIFEDTNTKLVLTNERYEERLKNIVQSKETGFIDVEILEIDSEKAQEDLSKELWINVETETSSRDLAYIIYTSGTTGNPKGVMIEHRGVVNLVLYLNGVYNFNKGARVTAFTSYVFDVSVSEIFSSLCRGGELYLLGESVRTDSSLISKYIKDNYINYVYLPPSLLSNLPKIEYEDLQGIVYAGEPCDKETGIYWSNKYKLYNYYGPTEITIYASGKQIKDGDTNLIGTPISNTRCYVLDRTLTPLPIGAVGELHIGGVGLARGYLNKPELTAQKFILNPFQTEEEKGQDKNARLYKTGDLVRWLPDGNLEYIGRNDFQVKIRGYRIELEEIESALSSYESIRRSVVLAKEQVDAEGVPTGNKYLVGYYIAEKKLEEESIFNYLHTKLPEYMVPIRLVHLENFPLTINGKLDRKALPEPEITASEEYLAPRNELESRVCEIWAEVLGLPSDKVGVRDDFFKLGGNSILAIRLTSRLNKILNSNFSVSFIFKCPTIDKLIPHFGHNTEGTISIVPFNVLKPEDQKLSFAQERLWFIERYEEGTNAYNVPLIYKLTSSVKLDVLENSFRNIVKRHEILRTVIKEDDEGNTYQQVLDDKEHPLEIKKVVVGDREELDEEISKEVNQIHDLSKNYPIKICLYELISNEGSSKEYYLSVVIHHIAFDGWSMDIFLREFKTYYDYYLRSSEGGEDSLFLPTLSIQYKDFALWQRSYLNQERLEKQLNYWKEKLNNYESLNLITDNPRPSQIDYKGAEVFFELDEKTSGTLRELAKELKVSLYSLLLSGYYLMLRSYSNQDSIVIGATVANRHYNQVENLIGFFVNSLPLRIEIDSESLIKEFIQAVGREVIGMQLHQDLPFERLVEELKVPKDTSRHPIFQVMFGIQSFGETVCEQRDGLTNLLQEYSSERIIYNVAKFDISTFIDDSQVCLRGSFDYAASLYNEVTIIGFIETYTEILRQFSDLANNRERQEETKIRDISYLSSKKYHQIIERWNQTDQPYPSEKTIQELFEEQVERTPENIALVYEETRLTYRELNERANQLANYLREIQDISPDTLIALCLDRSEHMLIAILGVLKSGGAYVPMDPSYPDDRIRYIMEDTDTKLVLTNERHQQKIKDISKSPSATIIDQEREVIALDSEELQHQLITKLKSNPKTVTRSTNLAYVIYTSGTTGHPKGVMIEHKGVVNLKYDLTIKYGVGGNKNNSESILQFNNYVFDASVEQIILSLLNGYLLLLPPDQVWVKYNEIAYYLNSNNITQIEVSPTFLTQHDFSKSTTLKRLIIGGELLTKDIFKRVQLGNKGKLIITYGPTEATITSTINIIKNNRLGIGKPIANSRCYVLDKNVVPLPIGAVGELHIGGVGLARGYLNKPELTAQKFILNPFQTEEEKTQGKNARLYKTGDLVRWLPDGNLEYIGRNDFQVKIRGYRIELEEIESALSSYESIRRSVVLAKEQVDEEGVPTGNKYLVGYYIAEKKLEEESIFSYLHTKLPEYMVPIRLVHLENFPLTINGKLDRKALPEPEVTASEEYLAPRNELESHVCEIWAEVLGLPSDKVGVRDDFFKLGGNSILAIKLINLTNSKLDLKTNVIDIFQYKNIESFISCVTKRNCIFKQELINEYEQVNV